MPVTIICQHCGSFIRCKPSHAARTKFCSRECQKAFTASRRLIKTCSHCGIEYSRPNWKVWEESVYCSLECRYEAVRLLPPEKRESMMAECREATRSMIQTDEHRYKIARTKQGRAVLSGDEAEIMGALNAVGLNPIPIYAVHRYNIDFAFPDLKLAIEYNGGNWHNTPKKRREDEIKTAYLESEGWTVVFFPRLDKPQDNDAGNERIHVSDLVREVQRLIHRLKPHRAA